MGENTPQWLDSALDEALVEAGATAPRQIRLAFVGRLTSAWNLGGRRLHNCKYLAGLFERLDQLEGATTEPEMLKLAAAFRGALEEPGWEESEELRGPTTFPPPVTWDDLRRLGISEQAVNRIEELTSQLSSHSPSDDDLGARILVDADLAALALTPQQYRDFRAKLREECAHMSERDYLVARQSVLRTLLDRRQIFTTPVAAKWEEAARENIEAELAGIEAKVSRLEEEKPGYMPPSFPPKSDSPPKPHPGSKPSPGKPHPRVLRISRSQKAARLSHEEAAPAETREELLETTAEAETEQPHEKSSASDAYVSDTSTLESVADLIEGSKTGTPPPVK